MNKTIGAIKEYLENTKYQSITNMSVLDAINVCYGYEGLNKVKELGNYEEAFDVLLEAFKISFRDFYARRVRSEIKKIRELLKDQAVECDICGVETNKIEMHHRLAVCQGGGNEPVNIMFLCHECHKKMNKQDDTLVDTKQLN